MSEILAKSVKGEKRITLSKHTEDILLAFENLKNRIGVNKELENAIKVAIYLHDLGKSLPSFQIKTLKNTNYEPFDISYEVPHSLFSLFFINKDKLLKEFGKEYYRYIISAVAYHHWRESFDEFISYKNEQLTLLCEKLLSTNNSQKEYKEKQEKWGEILESNLLQEFSRLNFDKEFIKLNNTLIKGIKNGRTLMNFAIPPYKFDYEPIRKEVKKDWILIAGFLQRCDHFASWCEEEDGDLSKIEVDTFEKSEVEEKIKKKITENAWQFTKINDINIKNKNVILMAPTGYGKTEFAFLWGSESKKFLYTLPIRSAVNQMFEERAQEIFGKDKTGLLHSDADVYLLEKSLEIESMKPYELSRQLSFPVIISTGDQFFPYGLRPPGYEKIFALLSYSHLVIDEIQAYDPRACAIITKFMEWMYKLGGKTMLITATLPKFVKDRIEKIIPEDERVFLNIYEDEKENFKKIFKHKVNIRLINNESNTAFDLPEEEIKRIISYAEKGKRVLVILNTINFAQKVYERIKNSAHNNLKDRVYLLHSRYTFLDRRNKEIEYTEAFKNPKGMDEKDGKILVSTQVVEASLDMDADVMFTEISPLDSLVQRMGRVLRRFFYINGKVLNKSNSQEIELSKDFVAYDDEPNVYIWVFKKGLQSGRANVYPEELVKFSLLWLWGLKDKGLSSIEDLMYKLTSVNFEAEDYSSNVVNILKDEFSSLLSLKDTKKFYDVVTKKDDWINKLKNIDIDLSEYAKYVLVNLFYMSLNPQGIYLKKFEETLRLLDSGWMSEKKSEAERIFREIYSVSVVPESLSEDFKKEIKDFIENEENFNYTSFKSKIISRYCVSIDLRIYMREEGSLSLRKASELLYDVGIRKNYERMDKVVRWLEDIYYDPYSGYTYDFGFKK